jgi:GTP-binding protein
MTRAYHLAPWYTSRVTGPRKPGKAPSAAKPAKKPTAKPAAKRSSTATSSTAASSAPTSPRSAAAASQEGGWRVASAVFEQSASGRHDAPPEDLPEIAVAGRSNVGKSSLFNAFVGQRGLARVSRTPGRTQLLNFFRVRLVHPKEEPVELRWVDLPGYGFAKVPVSIRESFGPMIEGYLAGRTTLRGMLLLVDARRGLQEEEYELVEFANAHARPVLVVATKIDKMSANERGLVPKRFAAQLDVSPRMVLCTSDEERMGLGDDKKGGLARELVHLLRHGTKIAPRD